MEHVCGGCDELLINFSVVNLCRWIIFLIKLRNTCNIFVGLKSHIVVVLALSPSTRASYKDKKRIYYMVHTEHEIEEKSYSHD